MRIYLKNNPAKFHHDPIGSDGALSFIEARRTKKPQQNNNNEKNNNKIIYGISSWSKNTLLML